MKNRIIRAATGDHDTNYGHYSDKDFARYEALAKGGVGTIITGYAYVADYPMAEPSGMLGIDSDDYIKEYQKLTEMVHSHGSNLILQIAHVGGATLAPGDHPIIAPSAVENPRNHQIPQKMSKEDILRVEDAFAAAALRAKKAGFDGIEVHGGHGFLISQFLTPHYNRRTDEYGGSDEKRARFAAEVCQKIRDAVGQNFPIFFKLNCFDGKDITDGITREGLLAACQMLKKSGVSLIEISGAWMECHQKTPYFLDDTAYIAEHVSIPVSLVGGVRDMDTIQTVFSDTNIQYVSMSRPLIMNPNLPNDWKNGISRKSDCRSCNACAKPDSLRCVFVKEK